jgi:hypothetical protein
VTDLSVEEIRIFKVELSAEPKIRRAVSFDVAGFQFLRQLRNYLFPINRPFHPLLLLPDDFASDEPVGEDLGGVDRAGGVLAGGAEDAVDAGGKFVWSGHVLVAGKFVHLSDLQFPYISELIS